jgi:hypothetical protein
MGLALMPPGPNTIHLCVDMQNLFAPGGPWATPWMEKTLPSVARPRRIWIMHGPATRRQQWSAPSDGPNAPLVLEANNNS